MESEDRHDIMEVRTFVDSKHHEVRQFSQAFGKNKKEDFFLGIAVLNVKVKNPMTGQEGVREVPLEFPFPDGLTLKKAFETFDAEAQKHVDAYAKAQKERHEAEQAKSRIVTARGVPNLKVVGPNGKPIGG